MGTDEARIDVQGSYQEALPFEERIRFISLTVNLSKFRIYDRDISRWYHLTWGNTVWPTLLLGMGALAAIYIMWTLGTLLNGDYYNFAIGLLTTVAIIAMFWYLHYMLHGRAFGYVKWFDMGVPDLVDPILAAFTERDLDHVLYREVRPDMTLIVILKLPDDGRRIMMWENWQTTIVHVANAGLRDDKATRRICGYIDGAAASL